MQVKKLYNTSTIEFYSADMSTHLKLPLVVDGISAGFPSPADNFPAIVHWAS